MLVSGSRSGQPACTERAQTRLFGCLLDSETKHERGRPTMDLRGRSSEEGRIASARQLRAKQEALR